MSVLEAIVLGIVQGLTEFLPVSSSGHLVIGQELLGVALPGISFEVAVHLGTLLSILIAYRVRVGAILAGLPAGDRDAWREVGLLVLASIPAAIVGIGFGDAVETAFEDPRVPGVALLVTALLLASTRIPLARTLDRPITPAVALWIGVAQALAITPGISRSGATVVMALWLGLRTERAAEFSFLLAIPAIAGAALLQAGEVSRGGVDAAPLLAGTLAAAGAGVLAIRIFLSFLRRRSFASFALYCLVAGGGFLGWLALRGGAA